MTDKEDTILQAFVQQETMDSSQLQSISGFPDAAKVLNRLKEKYGGFFGPFISLPGKKGAGGYRVQVLAVEATIPQTAHI